MTTDNFTLPLFPLSVFLLPQGITRLRIFEPRYLNMVSIAMKNKGFAIVSNMNQGSNIESNTDDTPIWASWVNIINFDKSADNSLIIEVQCHDLVQITNMHSSKNNLLFGDVFKVPHWPKQPNDDTINMLTRSLTNVFQENSELNDLYQGTFEHNANWVVARWLELLPVDMEIKAAFAQANSFMQAKMFVAEIISQAK